MLDLLAAAGSTHTTPTLTVLLVSVGMLALAAADIWRHEVEDYATAVLLLIVVAGLAAEGISAQQWANGALSAALAFVIYLTLGMRGVMGGGDVKLSVVPALVLGACSPFLGVWWVAAAIVIQQAFFLVAARHAGEHPVALPHVPAMATAVVLATAIFPA